MMVVGETEVGMRMLEPKFTSAPLTNPLPVIVRGTKSPLPASAIGGESRVMLMGQSQGTEVTASETALLVAFCADALISTEPVAMPVASPFASMLATVGSLVVHANTTPLIACPF